MASIRFKTYGKGVINAPIYIRFSNGRTGINPSTGEKYNGVQLEIKSGIIIPNSDYLLKGKTRRLASFKDKENIQEKLTSLDAFITERLNSTNEYTKVWLLDVVDEYFGKSKKDVLINPLLTELIEKYCIHIIDSASDQRKQSTMRTYKVTIKRIQEYEQFTGNEYRIDQIGVTFKNDFISWSRNVKKYNTSTFVKSVKQIKTVCRYAKRIGFKVDESLIYDDEKLEANKPRRVNDKPIFVNVEEIEKLMQFNGHDYLENARDWFVISCWTGCRVSDLMELTIDKIFRTIDGETAIRYTQNKTGETVTTPYHPHVDSILKKTGAFPRPISDQKFNKYIKKLCQEVGLNDLTSGAKQNPATKRMESGMFPKYELITAHTGRRSFASNHYGKFPIEKLMLVTGHKTVRQFLEYVGEHHQEHVTTLNQYYREGVTTNTSNLNISSNG
jgi:integrase